ncbi:branched-chain amino acid ABC transporter substrate-binding protein [Rhodococcus sp. X156]|uniref:branched-chain amino acid ABC transporter substrate-binding protein n=1 Tax=Rhodococcus sp. X156 TaxID=2499145 RepID=UPI000FD71446|nr:branched-chain amino acid ABC transporter substrate-binding protein [Rhodococcus sp. X156]
MVLVGAATLTLSACGSKSSDSSGGSGSSAPLAIAPLVQIDQSGKEVAASSTTAAADPAGDGKATCTNVKLAFAGAKTGPNAALGINIRNGAKVALDAHNKANPGCQVEMVDFDTEGDPQKATQVAPQIVSDPSVIGLLGPAFSGETKATGGIFAQAGLPSLSASATNVALTTNGWKTFYRGLANDGVQGPSVAKYLTDSQGFKKICVVQDDSDYGVGLAKAVEDALGSAADKSCSASVKTGDKDFSATSTSIKSANADAIFYAGYFAEAAPLVTQLRSAGVTAKFVSADGTNDPEFVKQAGSSAQDALLSCPCGPAPDSYKAAYKAANNAEPGVYSTEGYDLTTIMLKGIDAGKTTRADLAAFVKSYDGAGLARNYKWNDKGELDNALIWMYQVK